MATLDEILLLVFVCGIGGLPLLALFCVGCSKCLDAIDRIQFEPVESRYQPVIIQQEISPYV
jgi:hypothetical protein